MNALRDVALPERRPDGTWRYPVQVVLQTNGKWQTGKAWFETVGYTSDLEHKPRLQAFLK
jgi:hypothetical protein